MADKRISALTGATTPLAGTEVLPIVQSGATVKVSVANLTAGRAVSASSLSASSATISGVGTFGELATKIRIGTNGDSIGSDGDLYIQTTASKVLVLRTNFTEAIRLETNQDGKVTNGNLVIGTAGKGIDFSADPSAAGMTSELLDDYEEGTFTATWSSLTGTPANTTGYYTKVGRLVYFTYATGSGAISGSSATVYFTIPFTPASFAAGSQISEGVAQSASILISTNARVYPTGFSAANMVFSGSFYV